jgi:hypothetical protein
MTDKVTRGFRGIQEVVERMTPLMEWTKQFKPEQMHLTLARRDYDLIKRYRKAAEANDIYVVNGREIWWRGLELVYDSGPSRYPIKQPSPVQADVEHPLAPLPTKPAGNTEPRSG